MPPGPAQAMIEELTPQVLMTTMLLIVAVAPVLTLVLSMLLLWRYRRAVERAMGATSGFEPQGARQRAAGQAEAAGHGARESASMDQGDLARRALRAPWRSALRYLLAGAAFALVFGGAAQEVFPSGLGVPGFLIAVWIYLWPAFLAVPLIVARGRRFRAGWFLAYAVVYALLGVWGATIHNLPEYRIGAIVLPSRSTVTPETMARLWLIVNAGPTLLMLLCLHRGIRAVAPLVLALVTAALTGVLASYYALFSPRGVDAAVATAVALGVHIYWLLLAALLLSLAVFGLAGWLLIRWIARAYRAGRVSDQSLLLDALWLLFASVYSMWLVSRGVTWIAVAPVAFAVFKLTWILSARLTGDKATRPAGLAFLRVFALGRRTEALLQQVAAGWRHVGSIQLITGPDLARSTVQPHQFLDFLGGKLDRHFVSDRASLERSMAERDRRADPDGRFRINNFFCHADSWKAVLPELVRAGDLVLMDLRSFSADNAGCIHELKHLVAEVPYRRCLLIVDGTTDEPFLDAVLAEAASGLSPGSPNHGLPPATLQKLRIDPGAATPGDLVRRLCEAAGGGHARPLPMSC